MANPIIKIIFPPEKPIRFPVPQINLMDMELDALIQIEKASNTISVTGERLTVIFLNPRLRKYAFGYERENTFRKTFCGND